MMPDRATKPPDGDRTAQRLRLLTCTVLAGMLAPAVCAEFAHAQKRETPVPVREITLRLAEPADAARIELVGYHTGHSQQKRQPVSDLVVKLRSADGQPLAAALGAPNAGAPAKSAARSIFVADLLLVAEGRIRFEEGAKCAPWRADVAICQTPCEGGAFALVRRVDNQTPSLRFVLGQLPSADGQDKSAAVRLGQCREHTGLEWALEPAAGARQATLLLRVE